jgi:hypothetical protein
MTKYFFLIQWANELLANPRMGEIATALFRIQLAQLPRIENRPQLNRKDILTAGQIVSAQSMLSDGLKTRA